MTKIAFIGAGSFGFTRNLVRDILTFPLLEDATLALMDIDPERLEFIRQAVQRIVDDGKYPAKVVATMDRRRGAQGRGRRHRHHPRRRRGRVAARHPHPQEVRRRHQRGRHARAVGHLPRAAHDPRDAGHLQGYGRAVPRRDDAQLHQPDGDVVPRDAARVLRPADRPLPQRAGHGGDAGQLDRRADGRDHVHLRGHQPPGVVRQVRVERQGRLSR